MQAEARAKKEAELAIPSVDFFRTTRGSEFSEYDPEGIPTKLADGGDVSKSMRDKLKKVLDKHKSAQLSRSN